MGKFNKAFSLAEVLLAITVVGVVASLTIPTVINKSIEERYITNLKKNISVLNAVMNQNIALNETPLYDSVSLNRNKIAAWFVTGSTTGTTPKNLRVLKFSAGSSNSVWLVDGTRLAFLTPDTPGYSCPSIPDPANFNPHSHCNIFIDVNGDAGPNVAATSSNASDMWVLGITNNAVLPVKLITNSTHGIATLKDINGDVMFPPYSEIPAGNNASYAAMVYGAT